MSLDWVVEWIQRGVSEEAQRAFEDYFLRRYRLYTVSKVSLDKVIEVSICSESYSPEQINWIVADVIRVLERFVEKPVLVEIVADIIKGKPMVCVYAHGTRKGVFPGRTGIRGEYKALFRELKPVKPKPFTATFRCPFCGAEFESAEEWKKHIERCRLRYLGR